VQALAWSQPGGKDAYDETRAFIVSPPIFTMAPGGAQIVRIALRGQPAADVEQSYRLMFREVPAPEEKATDQALFHIALNMDIPMYVAPAQGVATPLGDFGFDAGAGGPPRLRIANKGNGNLRLTELAVRQGQEKLAGEDIYVVLPGATRYITLPPGQFRPGVPLRVEAQSNAGRIDVAVPVAAP
jgi:fimbrial chaperone protein